jgi:hypothetical protein
MYERKNKKEEAKDEESVKRWSNEKMIYSSLAWWLTSIVLATTRAEPGGSFEPRSSRPA